MFIIRLSATPFPVITVPEGSVYIFNCLLLLDCFLSLIFSPTSFTGLKCSFNLFFFSFFFFLAVCVRGLGS